MKYKVGDTVWYIDTVSTEVPRIRQDIIVETACTVSTLFKLKNHYHSIKKELIHKDKLFPTKEALLAAIDPPPEPVLIGYACQGIWDNKIMIAKCFEGDAYASMPDSRVYTTVEDLLKAKQWL